MKKLFLLTLALLAAATAGARIHIEGYRQSDIAPAGPKDDGTRGGSPSPENR